MKKTLAALMLILTAFSLCAYDFAQPMLGYVGSTADLSFELDSSVLPVNLDSPEVLNTPGESPRGKKIATWSFVTNISGFSLKVIHTPLVLAGSDGNPVSDSAGTKLTRIDYRLYLFTSTVSYSGSGSTTSVSYRSCLSSAAVNPAAETTSDRYIRLSGSAYNTVNQSVYINLEDTSTPGYDDTAAVVAALKEGTYSSTIYFLLESMQ